jgi:hypothetical protein
VNTYIINYYSKKKKKKPGDNKYGDPVIKIMEFLSIWTIRVKEFSKARTIWLDGIIWKIS